MARVGLVLGAAAGIAVATVFVAPMMEDPLRQLSWQRISRMWALYQSTMNGSAMASMWFRNPGAFTRWSGFIPVIGFFVFGAAALIARAMSSSARPNRSREWRFCLWLALIFAGLFLQIVITPQAGGPHHAMMLFPLDIMACVVAAHLSVSYLPRITSGACTVAGAAALLVFCGAQMGNLSLHFQRFTTNSAFKAHWNPAVEELVAYLDIEGMKVDVIHCIDWGIWQQAVSLCHPEVSRKIHDSWPTFRQWDVANPNAAQTARAIISADRSALYISFASGDAVFPQCYSGFIGANEVVGRVAEPQPLPAHLAQAYEIFKVSPAPEARAALLRPRTESPRAR